MSRLIRLLLYLIKLIVAGAAKEITGERMKAILDGAFDVIENKVAATTSTLDDILVLPVIRKLRELLDVPDNDQPAENAGEAGGAPPVEG
jgi:hypothetical protein